MGLIYKTNINSFKSDKFMRLDIKYRILSDKYNFNLWNIKDTNALSTYITKIQSKQIKKGKLDKKYKLIDLKSIEPKINSLNNVEEVLEIGSDKAILQYGDIVIPKLEPQKGQIFLNIEHNQYIASTELIEYTINTNLIIEKFLYYILVSPIMLKAYSYLESGKTHRRVQIEDLLKIQIPNIDLAIQKKAIKQIEPIEQEIQNLKSQKKEHLEIINDVFSEELDFDFQNLEQEKNKKFFKAKFSDFSNDEFKFDISLKDKLVFEKEINKSTNEWLTLNDIVIIKGGKRLPKGETVIDDDTGYMYIRVDDLNNNGLFNYNNIKFITHKNHLKIQKYIAYTDDILLTIVGATVGKCGLVPKELNNQNITENFARLIIKNKNLFLPQYILYCLQSKIVKLQIDEFTGKGSQGKLALFRIKKIKIPFFEKNKQQQIVDKITTKIDAQKEIDKQIEQKQKQIGKIIEDCIKGKS